MRETSTISKPPDLCTRAFGGYVVAGAKLFPPVVLSADRRNDAIFPFSAASRLLRFASGRVFGLARFRTLFSFRFCRFFFFRLRRSGKKTQSREDLMFPVELINRTDTYARTIARIGFFFFFAHVCKFRVLVCFPDQ